MGYEATGEQRTEDLSKWQAWDEFLEATINTGFRQSSWYTAFRAARGWRHFGTVLRDGKIIVGGIMVLARYFAPDRCYYYVPDGPVLMENDSSAEQEQVFRVLMEFIENKRQNEQGVVSHLAIEPRWEQIPHFVKGFEASSEYYGFPRDTQFVDLSSPDDAILAQMQPKGRYNIGVARRHGVSVVEDASPQGLEDFFSIYRETCDRKGLAGLNHDHFQELTSMLFPSNRGSIFFAEYQGTRLTTALVVYFGCTATYFYGGSRPVHRNVMASYMLHFEIMRKAKIRGCRFYDLFGVTPKGERSDGWTDISVFKRKFGGREVRFVPTLECIYDSAAYEEWKAIDDE
jgi:lipid II:glycine glycyltransferase (peptidoglycan interpeptide bridge formation enzyme)